MELRVKQRLVGAIALIAIVVIVVPELLTGERPPAPAAPAPSPIPTRTVTIDLASSERGPIERPIAVAAPASASQPTATNAPADTAPAPAAPPLAAAAAVEPRAAPAAAAPNESRTTAAAVAQAEAWIVQLGSFASRDNAEHLASGLRAKGYTAFVAEFRGSGRVLYRVRVGPEQDRARADAIAARLAREGFRGSVAPEP